MSDRNTGLFIPGHVSQKEVGALLSSAGAEDGQNGCGEVRVGHGEHKGTAYSHVGVELFEKAGLVLMDQLEWPHADDPELQLAVALSEQHGLAVYLFYDEERGAGGHALFRAGKLESRKVVDGRDLDPVVREGDQEEPLSDLSISDWVWPAAGDAVESGAKELFGPGIRTDDDIEALIRAAGSEPVVVPMRVDASTTTSQVRSRDPVRAGRLRGLLARVKRETRR
ncbi:MAG: hypothetical protein VX519_04880 [Myxococcota bacterium]|nr:hypothetical protein [Myxococcota bacterium]